MSDTSDETAGRPEIASAYAAAESGPREPASRFGRAVVVALCLAWSGFQLYIAEVPFDSWQARSIHLAFGLALCFLVYPAHRRPMAGRHRGSGRVIDALTGALLLALAGYTLWRWDALMGDLDTLQAAGWSFVFPVVVIVCLVEGMLRVGLLASGGGPAVPAGRRGRALRRLAEARIPSYDIVLAVLAAGTTLFIVLDYEQIIWRQGLPGPIDVWVGMTCTILLLEAARRALGPALSILGAIFLAYLFLGPYLPEIIRHRGLPLDFAVNDIYLSTSGIFGIPLGVSTSFVFLFVLFGALLERAGAGKYFIDIALAAFGRQRGGPAKAAIVASGLNGMVSGSSTANTLTTGTFTIPLMKKVGLPAHKAGAVEVAASTNGQLMPPIMGAAAFIMAEILGIPYLDVVRAALVPALISYIALFYVVHLEALKLDLRPLGRGEVPRLMKTVLRGLHFMLPVIALVWFLVVERRSPIASVLLAMETLAVIMLVQRPIIALLIEGRARREGRSILTGRLLGEAFVAGLADIWHGLITGARNMIPIAIATAAAGIIVGVVSGTGLVGRFVTLIDVLAMGNIYLVLVLTAVSCLILGIGMPTTANYLVMASLMAPVIVELGGDAGLVFPLIAAHLFVFYFGILADDTPPVGLAAYAAAAISRGDPIRTGVQGFTYDMRTAILPFVFIFNTELLMVAGVDDTGDIAWLEDPLKIGFVFVTALAAMFAFAAMLQGWLALRLNVAGRLAMAAICLLLFLPSVVTDPTGIPREAVQVAMLVALAATYGGQKLVQRRAATAGKAAQDR